MPSVTARAFTSFGRLAARLPRVRGKNRAFLSLFDALHLGKEHIVVDTVLQAPVAYRVQLDLHSWLQRLAFINGDYEAETVKFLLALHRATQRRGYLLDIGANIGLISIPAALLLKEQQTGTPLVISVEAVPDNVAALRRNIAFNDAQALITVIDCAIGDQAGTADIQVEGDLAPGEGTGTANILPAGSTLDPNGTYKCVRMPVELSTLDTLSSRGQLPPGCAVVKIDTDGYDLKVLQGATEFLARDRPVIFGEFSAHCMRWHGHGLDDVIKVAHASDYMVWQRRSGSGSPQFSTRPESSRFVQDLLLVPSELAQALAWCVAGPD